MFDNQNQAQAFHGLNNMAGVQAAQESVMMQNFREFDVVARDYAEACHQVQVAEQRKAAAFQRLQELRGSVQKSVEIALQDPTKPSLADTTPYMPDQAKTFQSRLKRDNESGIAYLSNVDSTPERIGMMHIAANAMYSKAYEPMDSQSDPE